MAIKADRVLDPYGDIIDFVCDEEVAAGTIMCYSTTGGSGTGVLDENGGKVTVLTLATGVNNQVAGVLITPVIDDEYETNRWMPNTGKVYTRPTERCYMSKRCFITTDILYTGAVPTPGKKAYLGDSGKFTDETNKGPRVGEFMGRKNEHGYVRVFVNIPTGS